MFKSVRELKAFITWAKQIRVKRVKIGDIEVEISDLAFIQEFEAPVLSQKVNKPEKVTLEEPEKASEAPKDDEDLFWSVSN